MKIHNGTVAKSLGVLLRIGPAVGLTDGQLLDHFLGDDPDVAELSFAAIVDRHGPMVHRICGQMLGNRHDAEDVFQATFLILARKAQTVRRRDSMASWLHGVACRVCLRTRLATARRCERERAAAVATEAFAPACEATESAEQIDLIHRELARLPERYRAPIVLCDLEDVAYTEAARLLGCPVGTVKSRLARGREQLRTRLARRGVAPTIAIKLTGVRDAVPWTLRDATARIAMRFATQSGPASAGASSTTAATLAEGMLKSMISFRSKIAVVAIGLTGLGATALVVLAGSTPADRPSAAVARNIGDPPASATEITKIQFEGNEKYPATKIRRQISSRVDQPLDPEKINADLQALMKTSWFADARWSADEIPPASGLFCLTFHVREMPIARKIVYRGIKSIAIPEIEHTTGLKNGRPADPVRTNLAVRQIERLYLERGYTRATVAQRVQDDSGDSKVVIEVFEGLKPKLASIAFEGNRHLTNLQLTALLSRKRQSPESADEAKILREMVAERRFPIPYDVIERDKQRMTDEYQSLGFLDCQVQSYFIGENPGELQLTYHINEGYRYVMRKIVFVGNKRLTSEQLRDGLPPMVGTPISKASIDQARKTIVDKYKAIGLADAHIVSAEFKATGLETVTQVDLIVEIAESKR